MRIDSLSPSLRPLASKAAAPGSDTVTSEEAKALFENYVADNHVPLINGNVDKSQIMPGIDDLELYHAEDLKHLVDAVEEGTPYVPPKPEGLLGRLFGSVFNDGPNLPSNTEGFPSWLDRPAHDPAPNFDWLDQARSKYDPA